MALKNRQHRRRAVLKERCLRHLLGKLYADKGDIGSELFHNTLAEWPAPHHKYPSQRGELSDPLADKVMLRKHFLI